MWVLSILEKLCEIGMNVLESLGTFLFSPIKKSKEMFLVCFFEAEAFFSKETE